VTRGPQAGAEQRIRSAHRAIEIREAETGPLAGFCPDYLAHQPPPSVNDASAAMRHRPMDTPNAQAWVASIMNRMGARLPHRSTIPVRRGRPASRPTDPPRTAAVCAIIAASGCNGACSQLRSVNDLIDAE